MAFLINSCRCTTELLSVTGLRRMLSTSTEIRRTAKLAKISSDMEKDPEALDVKEKVFRAALPFVSSDGWSREAIIKGAKAAGLPSVAHGLFTAGGVDLVAYFYMKCNSDLHEWMLEEKEKRSQLEKDAPSKTTLIRDSVQHRLRMLEPYEDRWPEAMGLLTVNPRTGFLVMSDLIDDIWYVAGDDQSVDFNWYTKRMTLTALYEATQIFMMQDTSPNKIHTWDFLDRRVDNLFTATSLAKGFGNAVSVGSGAVVGLTLSVKNMLGLNQWFR